MIHPDQHDYLKLFELYAGKLDFSIKGTKGGDYAFLFQQVMRLMQKRSPFNTELPAPFLAVVQKYSSGDPAIVAHFNYNENRQFFLSDLYDYLQLRLLRDRHRPEGQA